MYRKWNSKIAILQKIPTTLPCCDQCGMQKLWGPLGQDSAERKGGQIGVKSVIQGGGTVYSSFRIRVVVPVRSDGKDGGRDLQSINTTDHKEAGAVESIHAAGDVSGRGSYGGSRNAVRGHIHWPQAGGGSPVGGIVPYF